MYVKETRTSWASAFLSNLFVLILPVQQNTKPYKITVTNFIIRFKRGNTSLSCIYNSIKK